MKTEPAQQEKKRRGHRKLIKEEEAEIYRLICLKRPWQCRFKSSYRDVRLSLWSRSLVMQLIEQRYGIGLSDGGVAVHLKRWGFPPLNMKKQANAGCTKAIRNWLDVYYASIQERARSEGAKIFWMSKMVMSDPELGIVPEGRSGQQQLSMVCITTNQSKVHWLVIKGQFSPERQIMFLKSLIGEFREKIFMIRNNLEYYTSLQVRNWIRENRSRIELFPPPEWNPGDKQIADADALNQAGPVLSE